MTDKDKKGIKSKGEEKNITPQTTIPKKTKKTHNINMGCFAAVVAEDRLV